MLDVYIHIEIGSGMNEDFQGQFSKFAKLVNIILVPVQLIFVSQIFTSEVFLFSSYTHFSNLWHYFYVLLFLFYTVLYFVTFRIVSLKRPISLQMLLHQGFFSLFIMGDYIRQTIFGTSPLVFRPFLFTLIMLLLFVNTCIFIYVRGFMSKSCGEQLRELLEAFTIVASVASIFLFFSVIEIAIAVNPLTEMKFSAQLIVGCSLILSLVGVSVNIWVLWLGEPFDRSLAFNLLLFLLLILIFFLYQMVSNDVIVYFTWQSIWITTILYSLISASLVVVNNLKLSTGALIWATTHLPIIVYGIILTISTKVTTGSVFTEFIDNNINTILKGAWFILGAALSSWILAVVYSKFRGTPKKPSLNEATVDELSKVIGIGEETAERIDDLKPFRDWEQLLSIKSIGGKRIAYLKNRFSIP